MSSDLPAPHRSRGLRTAMLITALLFFCGFMALGVWQVVRLSWKLDLIERVESRVKAPAVAAPSPDDWRQVNAVRDEYRHVSVTGRYLQNKSSLTQAATELGGGFWQLAPLQTASGEIYYVNRGFLRTDQKVLFAQLPTDDVITVVGLLRISEPVGGFLRRNDAANQRWFSRDVAAMAAAQGLPAAQVAPFFIDADASPGKTGAPQAPVAGLTVVRFNNNHLMYAVTWFSLALMMLVAIIYVYRSDRRQTVA